MKVYLKSDVECTVDGVGFLEPNEEVEVDVALFGLYHHTTPARANFPSSVTVIYDTSDDNRSAVGAPETSVADQSPVITDPDQPEEG